MLKPPESGTTLVLDPVLKEKAERLVSEGWEQISRKYRMLARLPPGLTGLEALREHDHKLVDRFLAVAEDNARFQYLRVYAPEEHRIELTREEFAAYLVVTKRSPGFGEL